MTVGKYQPIKLYVEEVGPFRIKVPREARETLL